MKLQVTERDKVLILEALEVQHEFGRQALKSMYGPEDEEDRKDVEGQMKEWEDLMKRLEKQT